MVMSQKSKNKVANGKIQKPKPKQTKPLAATQTFEIDDIFASKPAQQPLPSPPQLPSSASIKNPSSVKIIDASHTDKIANPQKQKLPPPAADDNFGDSRGQKSKYTEDGLRVFYMDDLRIGEGEGDTEQCPFDCNCCF
ncbi:hypothetical protein J3B02_001223 [Coemansia erecta]|uniref:DUF1764-domain-containing protein n=1 Tax=Coemansia asiatica TaxID=1052880 RepID=A0A9W8CGQ7_9FUNG|nr:hypothetical protein LPJ64_005688 [Coemansia asiatica]KAJ2857099.1 hypothetical protein J3B02_001223 [Coemansia erecta]KAJ2873786.1 hypothetical protein FB639_004171 [Coemansia asiatica]